MSQPEWDVFLSYASEDREAVAEPLARFLSGFAVSVWYDRFSLEVGDSIVKKIDEGLAASRYGVVIVSPAFIRKAWPDREYRGLVTREIATEVQILPVWHNVSGSDVRKFSPPLAGVTALRTSSMDLEEIAARLLKKIRPDRATSVGRERASRTAAQSSSVEIREVIAGPIRHSELSRPLIRRIQIIHHIFSGAHSMSLPDTIDNFRRDLHPEREVEAWEAMAAIYVSLRNGAGPLPKHRKAILGLLLRISMGAEDWIEEDFVRLPPSLQRAFKTAVTAASLPAGGVRNA